MPKKNQTIPVHIFCVLAFFFMLSPLSGQHSSWILKLKDDGHASAFKLNEKRVRSIEQISKHLSLYRLELDSSVYRSEIQNLTGLSEDLLYFHPNIALKPRDREPNDFFYKDQWSMDIIDAGKAWEQTTGGTDINGDDVVIAVLDDGFDLLHEDLIDNYWLNPFEVPGDAIDNDGNGYIDDVMGVNIQTGNDLHAGVKHGTQVSGIIGAKGNNSLGITGLNWDARLLLISGVSNIAEVIKSMEYLYELKRSYIESNGSRGANIVVNNFSGGIERAFPSDFQSWCEVYDLMGSVGVLSVGAVANINFDVESEGDMPTLCESEFLITVTNTNLNDNKVIESAIGKVSVDIGAPGENIISPSIGNDYDNINGTSASAPHVTGAVGLIASLPCPLMSVLAFENPEQYARNIKNALVNSADVRPSLEKTVSGGRLNIFNAMLAMRDYCGAPETGMLDLSVFPNYIDPTQQNRFLRLEYMTDRIESIELSIYDMSGKRWYSESLSPPLFEDGVTTIPIDVLRLHPGMYVVHMSNTQNHVARKLIVLK